MVYDGVRWCTVVYGGCVVVYGGVRVVYAGLCGIHWCTGGIRWCTDGARVVYGGARVVYGGVRWCTVVYGWCTLVYVVYAGGRVGYAGARVGTGGAGPLFRIFAGGPGPSISGTSIVDAAPSGSPGSATDEILADLQRVLSQRTSQTKVLRMTSVQHSASAARSRASAFSA